MDSMTRNFCPDCGKPLYQDTIHTCSPQHAVENAMRLAGKLEAAERELARLRAAITKLHAAKGRYHTQLAVCDLFELCGLTAERPKK